ncbi:cadherin-related family member 2 [Varanus komodoensis]|uniref:cadherin-related family member 2 n=1 Tax=Varanus komodoensis TaxID=61221 RepID=UPI001CF7BF69|nr:cadherin-related family member 2 [Varanus komodoensis]
MVYCRCVRHMIFLASGNTAPRFDMNSSFSLPEDTPVGAWVFQLVAVDVDGDKLFYSLAGENSFYFSVNSESGNVTLKQRVDYELTKTIRVEAKVTDRLNVAVSKTLTIIVKDRNDNKPIFQNEPYFTEVLENTPVGSPIYNVLAFDEDSGTAGQVSYSIEEVTPNNAENRQLFYIFYNGTVVLNGSLSYNNKSTFYRIKILARDNGGQLNNALVYQNNTAYLSVTVVDVADLDPEFLGGPYVGSVPENCPLGTPVVKVFAIDRDKGVNDIIHYSITNITSLFTIDTSTGVITVSGHLDREGVPGEEVQLHVVAQEETPDIYQQVAQVSTTVSIQVTDINDNTPQFYQCTYPACNFSGPTQSFFSGQIEEHASARTPVANLTIVAYDPDKGSNGTFQLSLQGPDAAAFSVSPQQIVNENAVQVLVRNSALVDYEKSPVMTVEIVANDTGRGTDCCSIATVSIQLLDINDHRPEFQQSSYKLYVLEESPPGTVVASNITATDPDSGTFGEITYQLLPESIHSTFTVIPRNGTVLVAPDSQLDWGVRPFYYATLQAMDGGGLSGSTQLEISVLDINNKPPVVTGSYNIFVTEGQGNVSVQIQATDQDEPGTNNSRLQYEIVPGEFSNNFTITPDTGVLSSRGPLDREAIPPAYEGRIVVTVLVHDLGVPQLSTTVNVTITVEDRNDNAPRFSQPFYEFSVKEGLPGVLVGDVEATDADQTEINNRISFYITNSMGSSNFLIRSSYLNLGWYQGTLSLDPDIALDYDRMEQKFFSLTVQAENSDFGGHVDADNATVKVNVEDVNDEPPAIVPSPPRDVVVLENATLHESVATLTATDMDTRHSLIFQQLAVACLKDSASAGNVCQHWFSLEPNGSIIVNSSEIDYEACDLVELTLRAQDELTEVGEPYSNNETLRIIIADVNDNAPMFLPITDTFVIIPEVSPIDLQVAVVRATDADSGVNSVITFAISQVVFIKDDGGEQSFDSLFKVVTTVEKDLYLGSIQVASNLNSLLKGRYNITVEARDQGTPQLSSLQSLDLFTVDQSYRVKLSFTKQLNDVQSNADEIKVALSAATKTTVYIATIKSEESPSRSARASAKILTVMEAYFVYSNGTALSDKFVRTLIQENPEQLLRLLNFGLSIVGPVDVSQPNTEKELFGIIAGLAVAVLLVIVILILTIIGMRRSHVRKLNALKALKKASEVSACGVPQGPAIPGTNIYNTEGANPVLGHSLDPAITMDFEESPNYEVASLNSLDENMVDAVEIGPAAASRKGNTNAHNKDNDREELLKAALENYKKGKLQQQEHPKTTTSCLKNTSLNTTEV